MCFMLPILFHVVCELAAGEITSQNYEFLMVVELLKVPSMMKLCDKDKVIASVCLHYSILNSLGELLIFTLLAS